MTEKIFLELALKHDVSIQRITSTNELGLDFKTAVGEGPSGKKWLLRIPRRKDYFSRIQQEAKYLQFLKSKVSFNIPDWKVVTPELIAYPLLTDNPALEVNPGTQEFTWNINLSSFDYSESLASIIYELHNISIEEAEKTGLKARSIKEIRQELFREIDLVKAELGISASLEIQWRNWVDEDTYWPDFTVLNHGDLYSGHTLVNSKNCITGVIDWSEMQIGDSSLDFARHYMALGEQQLDKTIEKYESMGGATWPRMKEHIIQRASASPLKFAMFAITTKNDDHLRSAREQLGK